MANSYSARCVYHLTHLNNLPGIIEQGGLWSHNEGSARGVVWQSIAHVNIQERRARCTVPLAPNGTLHDYVPWFFGPRPPMLYASHRSVVGGYDGGQAPIVHLMAKIASITSKAGACIFTDVHAPLAYAEYYDDLTCLNKVDWDIMNQQWWNNTSEDPDRKSRRQAEFLVHRFCPWEAIEKIGVIDSQMAASVRDIVTEADHQPAVEVHRDWYY